MGTLGTFPTWKSTMFRWSLRYSGSQSFPRGLRYEEDAIKCPPQSWCYVEELK